MNAWMKSTRWLALAATLCLFTACEGETDPPTDPADTNPPPTDTVTPDTTEPFCGNGLCDPDETSTSCPEDCVDPPSECDINVDCDGPVPDCAAPLIPVNKAGCWGCGHPDTCTCSDGQPTLCDMVEPVCDEGWEMATVGGCFECVNPTTCAPKNVQPPPPNECMEGANCLMAPPFCEEPLIPVAFEDCFGYGYPTTCSCDDGIELSCKAMEPNCEKGTTMAIQDGCYACVDPMTCKTIDIPPPPPEPADTCKADADCTFTKFESLVTNTDECFCAMCPNWPVNKPTHAARAAAWEQHCNQWSMDKPCPMPSCADPGPIACENSQCVAASDPPPSQCDTNVFCDGPVPDCKAPLIPVNKDGCWGCGHPDTCTCSDGPASCLMIPPVCAEGMELATIDGCYQCVNPITCEPQETPPPTPNECAENVLCKSMPPECKAPLIPVEYKSCWGCGYPETCSCDDGDPLVCKMAKPACTQDTVLTIQNGCYKCVDPMTCKETTSPPTDECQLASECTITKYEMLVTQVSECFCPMCPWWPVTQYENIARKNAWNTICTAWEQQNPCPMPKCPDPGTPACDQGSCIKIPPPPPPPGP